MIHRDHYEGPINFTCDDANCNEHVATGEDDFSTAVEVMKERGWRNIRDGNNEWGHYCPTHKFRPFAQHAAVPASPAIIIEEISPIIQAVAPALPAITLGPQQQEAENIIMAWLNDSEEQCFVLAGFAGTGKTTLARKLAANLGNNVTFGAFTGKAVNILRDKGCPNVDTIHTLLYKPVGHDKMKMVLLQEQLKTAQATGDLFASQNAEHAIEIMRKEMRKPKFELNTESIGGNVLFVDEYSMLPNEVVADLRKKYRKILFMGDPFQLPPVKGSCNLTPNFFLTEIHRQALESAIVRLSRDIRENNSFGYGNYGDLLYIPHAQACEEMFTQADQVIVGRNATKAAVNSWVRKLQGKTSPYPVNGDKMICLKNNKKAGLFNGMICNAVGDAIKAQAHHLNYMLKIDVPLQPGYDTLQVWEGDVMGRGEEYDWNDFNMKSLNRFDFAYAITCHKSQGSEFNFCTVYSEPVGNDDEMKRRWLYTAVTRAKTYCVLIQPEG